MKRVTYLLHSYNLFYSLSRIQETLHFFKLTSAKPLSKSRVKEFYIMYPQKDMVILHKTERFLATRNFFKPLFMLSLISYKCFRNQLVLLYKEQPKM